MRAPGATDPTVLWRLTRDGTQAHATVLPGVRQTTITWFFDDVMDRAENFATLPEALARADTIKAMLLDDGWKEPEGQ